MESEVTDNNVAPDFFVLNDLCFKVLCYITNHCFDNLVVSFLWISEFVSQLSVFSRRISLQLVKKPTEIKLVIISDNLRNLIDGISCCFK